MPNILDYNKFCEDLQTITSVKVFKKRFFHAEGLFSEQIFGPLKNYTCQCGTYYGISKSGGNCKDCGVDIVNSNERRKRFAKIVLPIPVVNPLMYDLIVSLGGKAIKAPLDNLMKNEKSILYVIGDETFVVHDEEIIPKRATRYEKAEAIHVLVKTFSEMMYEDLQDDNWRKLVKNIDNFLIREIIVLPPDLRPSTQSGSKQLMDKINRYYIQILTKKEVMQASHLEAIRDKSIYYTFFRNLQKDVKELHEKILEKLAKKEGLIRGNILGKRIDFSGRAVIVPEPALSLDECVLPYKMILEIFKLQIAKRIIGLGMFKKLPTALIYINRCIKFNHLKLLPVCEEIIKGKVCILNRQPSLHRLGMLGFNIKVSKDSVIKVHPLICHPFNADFDGDQMAMYIPLSEETIQEVKDKMFVTKNLVSPANEQLTMLPSQDIVLGIYFLTDGKFDEDDFNGVDYFNSLLPDEYPPVKGTVNEKRLIQILDEVRIGYPDEIVDTLDMIKKKGFYYSTLSGCTLALDDFLIEDVDKIKDYIYETEDIYESLKRSSSEDVIQFLRDNFRYAYLIESGARGSWDQARQLCLSRGYISNFSGEIHDKPIVNNLTDGLNQSEFFDSTYGCRKGLLDTALNTGTSGYLSRKLIFTCANLQLSEVEDCGVKDFLEVNVTDDKKASCLINRFIEDGDQLKLITRENYPEIVGQKIKVRSPIYCKDDKVCRTCYGESHKTLNSTFIGIIAAQTLGEKSTQLVLRTFHTSGSAIIKNSTEDKHDMKQEDIIGDLSSVSTMLHKFDKDTTCEDLVHNLFSVYDRNVFQVHYECVVAQLMWVGMKKWRLHPERHKYQPKFHSIQSVPDQESWLLAMSFSNPRKSILHGIINSGNYSGIMDAILRGEKV